MKKLIFGVLTVLLALAFTLPVAMAYCDVPALEQGECVAALQDVEALEGVEGSGQVYVAADKEIRGSYVYTSAGITGETSLKCPEDTQGNFFIFVENNLFKRKSLTTAYHLGGAALGHVTHIYAMSV